MGSAPEAQGLIPAGEGTAATSGGSENLGLSVEYVGGEEDCNIPGGEA